MGRCHVFWVSLFFVFTIDHVLIHLFFSEVCSRCSSLFGTTLSSWWIFLSFGDGSQKVTVLQEEITSQWVVLVLPFIRTSGPCFLFQLPLSFRHVFFVKVSVLASSEEVPTHQPSTHPESLFLFIPFTLFVVDLHVTSWHFVLTWPLSLSLSRRGVLWRSCTRDTGFCAVVMVWVCQGQMLMATRQGGVPCREVRQVLL